MPGDSTDTSDRSDTVVGEKRRVGEPSQVNPNPLHPQHVPMHLQLCVKGWKQGEGRDTHSCVMTGPLGPVDLPLAMISLW